jgi:hypothetical protein
VIQKTGVVLVCGTRCSGKSTLGRLMIEYARNVMHKKAVYIDTWDHKRKVQENLFDAYRRLPGITNTLGPFSVPDCGAFFVLDEVQTLYSVRALWVAYLRGCSKTHSKTKFLLLARYDSDSMSKDGHVTGDLSEDQQVFLRAPLLPLYPPVSLFFNLPELTNTVQLHEDKFKLPYQLSKAAIQELFKVSHGHAGLATSLLEVIYESFGEEWRDTTTAKQSNVISSEAIMRYTSDTAALLTKLKTCTVSQSLVKSSPDIFTPNIQDVIMRILLRGPVLYNLADSGHRFVYTEGICQGQVERVRYHWTRPYDIISIVNVPRGSTVGVSGVRFDGDIVEADSTILVFPTQTHAR